MSVKIPARTTFAAIEDLYVTAACLNDVWRHPPYAFTTAELDAIRPGPRPPVPITLLGNPIVEIPDWPEWMP